MNHAILFVIAMGVGINPFAWLLVIAVAVVVIFRQRQGLHAQAEDRPADQSAGMFVNELVQAKRTFRAQGPGGAGDESVEIDGERATVTFGNFAFTRTFVGNPVQDRLSMPFSGILSAYVQDSRYSRWISVRTIQGSVAVSSDVQPFDDLADLLADIAELNRTSPTAYAAALAQEPKIKTAWYGWLILASAIGAVIYCWQKFIN